MIFSPLIAGVAHSCCSDSEPNFASAPAPSTTDSRYGTAAS